MIRTEQLGGDTFVGHAILDNPAALNALNHPMAIELMRQVQSWQHDPNCQAILISGEGDRAFCSGGDVKYVTQAQPGESNADRISRAADYFATEYALDELLHRSNTPVVVWGDGIVMGGGMGLLQGADFRIVTERTRMSMPETAIGFFTDVGANYFLNRVSFGLGSLLGISGAHLDGNDALFLNLADLQIGHEYFDAVKSHLSAVDWIGHAEGNRGQIGHLLRGIAPATGSPEASQAHQNIQTLMGLRDAPTLWHRFEGLKNLQVHHDAWLQSVGKTAAKASPLSVAIVDAYLSRHRHSSLSECFEADLNLANALVQNGEFAEGVRAVLIDKDQSPTWAYQDVRDVPADLLAGLIR